uniref:ABC-2 type transporter n=1 Tax=Rhodogorgon sp. TaxID=2485824 RepID=A0A3G3MHW7_9FLOR|nr:ABC-2 type transporter [Rhodogorgon sp.]
MNRETKPILTPRRHIAINYISLQSFIQEISCLIKRLLKQTARRPSTLISGIIQPLLWLVLFGALFQNAPVGLLTLDTKYSSFLSSGIIIFTAFTGSLSGGLSLVFDREFGFLNRLLASPLRFKDTLLSASIISIAITTISQTLVIAMCSLKICYYQINTNNIFTFMFIPLLITISISSISIGLALMVPGHIEFLACILLANLPILFSSTALAPLSFMPYWLQIIASLNPLTYAIESIRLISNKHYLNQTFTTIQTLYFNLALEKTVLLLFIFTIICFVITKTIISHKFE